MLRHWQQVDPQDGVRAGTRVMHAGNKEDVAHMHHARSKGIKEGLGYDGSEDPGNFLKVGDRRKVSLLPCNRG